MNLMVAASLAHANAMIRWLGHDPDTWVAATYGQELTTIFESALLVRPLERITDEQADWIIGTLIPRVAVEQGIRTHPENWLPGAEAIEVHGPAEFEPVQIWAS